MAKEAAQTNDPSMEEILQSIKRIIAEESTEGAEEAPASSAKNETGSAGEALSSPSGDVLELTDMVEEGEEEPEEEAFAPAPAVSSAPAASAPAIEPPLELSDVAEEEFEAPAVRESLIEATETAPAATAAAGSGTDVLDDIDSLLSKESAAASSRAFKSLTTSPAPAPTAKPATPGMAFRSGNTVEDLALEALRPMLKEWLDTNLPSIVERLVEREIKKLSNG